MSTLASNTTSQTTVWDDRYKQAFANVFGRDYQRNFQDPITFIDCTFYAPAVQTTYKRDFALISRTLFAEYVYRRRPEYNQTMLDNFASICANKLAAIRELLVRNEARVRKLLEASGIATEAGYLAAQQRVVPIIHGNAMQYVRCLQQLDTLLTATGTATLYGVLDSAQRRSAELQSRRALNAFAAMTRNESGKLKREAERVLSGAPAGGEDDAGHSEMKAAVALQAEAIASFDASVAQDKTSGHAAEQVSSENPEQDLDAAVSSGLAAAGSSGSKRARAAKTPAASD